MSVWTSLSIACCIYFKIKERPFHAIAHHIIYKYGLLLSDICSSLRYDVDIDTQILITWYYMIFMNINYNPFFVFRWLATLLNQYSHWAHPLRPKRQITWPPHLSLSALQRITWYYTTNKPLMDLACKIGISPKVWLQKRTKWKGMKTKFINLRRFRTALRQTHQQSTTEIPYLILQIHSVHPHSDDPLPEVIVIEDQCARCCPPCLIWTPRWLIP